MAAVGAMARLAASGSPPPHVIAAEATPFKFRSKCVTLFDALLDQPFHPITPVRNGFVVRSRPTVVAGP